MSTPITSRRNSITRRSVLGGLVTASSLGSLLLGAQTRASSKSHEEQRGDPDGAYEGLNFYREDVKQLSGDSKANWDPRAPDFAKLVSDTAAQFVGKSRTNARETISEMLELFNLPFQDESSGKAVPFCAAGLTYVVALAYVKLWKYKIELSRLLLLTP